MIQQVITCDVCNTQKRQANHWFVAREGSGELHISGWNSPHLLSPETKHLCGETCAHKLISQFLMKLVEAETKYPEHNTGNDSAAIGRIIDSSGSPSSQGMLGSPDFVRLKRSQPCGGRRA